MNNTINGPYQFHYESTEKDPLVIQRNDLKPIVQIHIPNDNMGLHEPSEHTAINIPCDGSNTVDKSCWTPQQREFVTRLGMLGIASVTLYAATTGLNGSNTHEQTVAGMVPAGFAFLTAMGDVGTAIINMCRDNPLPCKSDSLGNTVYVVVKCCADHDTAQKTGTYLSGFTRMMTGVVSSTLPSWEVLNWTSKAAKVTHAVASTVGTAFNGIMTFTTTTITNRDAAQANAIEKEQSQKEIETHKVKINNQNSKLRKRKAKIARLKKEHELNCEKLNSTINKQSNHLHELKEGIKTANSNAAILNKRNYELTQENTQIIRDVNNKGKQIVDLDKKNSELTQRNEQIAQDVNNKDKKIIDLDKKNSDAEVKIRNQESELKKKEDQITTLTDELGQEKLKTSLLTDEKQNLAREYENTAKELRELRQLYQAAQTIIQSPGLSNKDSK